MKYVNRDVTIADSYFVRSVCFFFFATFFMNDNPFRMLFYCYKRMFFKNMARHGLHCCAPFHNFLWLKLLFPKLCRVYGALNIFKRTSSNFDLVHTRFDIILYIIIIFILFLIFIYIHILNPLDNSHQTLRTLHCMKFHSKNYFLCFRRLKMLLTPWYTHTNCTTLQAWRKSYPL